MSIILYSGTPGSYKSYHAVQECLKWLKDGKNLITNFPLIYKKRFRKIKGIYEKVDNMQLTVDYLVEFAIQHHKKGVKAQTLIVIDEASIKFNSREFNNKDRMEWVKFLANHRHFNFDIILIAQQDRMIDRQIRSCIETEYKHRALKHYGFAGALLNLLFHGCYMCIEYWYPVKSRVGSNFGVFNSRIANCYDTMGLFVDSKNKMSVARQRADEELERQEKNKKSLFQKILQRLSMKRGVTVAENKHKRQVKKDISTFVNVLNSYVVRNSPNTFKS